MLNFEIKFFLFDWKKTDINRNIIPRFPSLILIEENPNKRLKPTESQPVKNQSNAPVPLRRNKRERFA